MPACAIHEGHSPFDAGPGQVGEQRPLLPSIDLQAPVRKRGAQRGRVALHGGIGDMAQVLSAIGVTPAQPLAPRLPPGITARAQYLEGA